MYLTFACHACVCLKLLETLVSACVSKCVCVCVEGARWGVSPHLHTIMQMYNLSLTFVDILLSSKHFFKPERRGRNVFKRPSVHRKKNSVHFAAFRSVICVKFFAMKTLIYGRVLSIY